MRMRNPQLTCIAAVQVQALQQVVMKIGEHLSGNKQEAAGSEQASGEESKGSDYDADVKDDDKKPDSK